MSVAEPLRCNSGSENSCWPLSCLPPDSSDRLLLIIQIETTSRYRPALSVGLCFSAFHFANGAHSWMPGPGTRRRPGKTFCRSGPGLFPGTHSGSTFASELYDRMLLKVIGSKSSRGGRGSPTGVESPIWLGQERSAHTALTASSHCNVQWKLKTFNCFTSYGYVYL